MLVWRGVVDLKLGIILGISMFLGAPLGGRPALEHRLAAADIHFCSACPSSQAAFAPALEVSLFEPEEARSKKHRYRLRPRYGGP